MWPDNAYLLKPERVLLARFAEGIDERGLLRPFHELGNVRDSDGPQDFNANQFALRVVVGHQHVFDDLFCPGQTFFLDR